MTGQSDENSIPVEAQNWLAQADEINVQEKQAQIVEECRERVLEKYFGPKIPEERILAFKHAVVEVLNQHESPDLNLFVADPSENAEFFTTKISVKQGKKGPEVEVRLNRTSARDAYEAEPEHFIVHERMCFATMEMEGIWIDDPEDESPPRVNMSSILKPMGVSVEQQIAALEGREIPVPPGTVTIKQMEKEYAGELLANGITPEIMENLLNAEMVSISTAYFVTRELRENLDDLFILGIIEASLGEGEATTESMYGKTGTQFKWEAATKARKNLLDLESPYPHTQLLSEIHDQMGDKNPEDITDATQIDKMGGLVEMQRAMVMTAHVMADIDAIISPANDDLHSGEYVFSYTGGQDELKSLMEIDKNKQIWKDMLEVAQIVLPHCYKFDRGSTREGSHYLPEYRVNLEEITEEDIQKIAKIINHE